MAKDIQSKLFTRVNKNYNTFYTRYYNPPTKSNKTVVLGKETESFTNEKAINKLNYLMKHLRESNFKTSVEDIILDYETIDITIREDKDKTFEQIAEIYFNEKYEIGEIDYFNRYRLLHKLKTIDDLKDDQNYKSRIKSFNRTKNLYINNFLVDEWNYKQEYLKRKKDSEGNPIPRQELTKVSIKTKRKISQKKIYKITKTEIIEWTKSIKKRVDIGEKTKYNIITQIATIFNWAIKHDYLNDNPFHKIDVSYKQTDPKNVRERILTPKENELIFSKFHKKEGLNSFNASLLLLATGARLRSVLSLRKDSFELDLTKNFIPRYHTVKLVNYKSKRKYIQPLPKKVGEYLYYLLLDYKDDEYVIRAINPSIRKNKPFAELPKDFKEICDEFINATPEMQSFYTMITEDKEKIEHYNEIPHLGDFSDIIDGLRERIKANKKTIKELKKEYLHIDNHENYLKNNFSAHNFRHMLSSIISEKSPIISSKLLDHSSNKANVNSQTYDYIKIPMNQVEVVMELTLKPYLEFLDEPIKSMKLQNNATQIEEVARQFYIQKEQKEYQDRQKALNINDNRYEIVPNESEIFEITMNDNLTELEKATMIDDLSYRN